MESLLRLHSENPPRTLSREQVWFGFPDGQLDYDCATCQALCCRAAGFQIDRSTAKLLAMLRPTLQASVTRATGRDHFLIQGLRPGCYFLTEDCRCSLHATQGYSAKPETCRLFPFNRLALVNDRLVVAPHQGLCPLRATDPKERSERSQHDLLFATMAAAGIGIEIPRRQPADVGAGPFLELELAVAEEAERRADLAGDYLSFALTQASLTDTIFPPQEGTRRSEVAVLRGALADTLGVSPSRQYLEEPDLNRICVIATTALRLELALQSDTGLRLPVSHLSSALLAMHFLAALALEAGLSRVTYQSLMQMLRERRSLIAFLAFLDSPVLLRVDRNIPWPVPGPTTWQSAYLELAKGLLHNASRPLWQILAETVPFEGVERVAFLSEAGRLLEGRLCVQQPINHRRSGLRSLRRWALSHLSHESLMKTAARRDETESPSDVGRRPNQEIQLTAE